MNARISDTRRQVIAIRCGNERLATPLRCRVQVDSPQAGQRRVDWLDWLAGLCRAC